jgi:2,5-furandicarboxylate decarboxylase 1
MLKDLRSYLAELEAAGELLRIKREVDPKTNLAGLAYQAGNRLGKATLFENLVGHPNWQAVSYICAHRRRLAIAIGAEPQDFILDMTKFLEQGLTPCRMVDTGPVKEVVQVGDQVDLGQLPIHVMSVLDAGPYIGSGMGIVKDPDTGIRNVALHRHQVKGRNKLGILIHPGRHTDMIKNKYEARGQDTPIAIAIGHHGAYYITACWTTSFGVDEYEITGTILGEPVEMVKCETIDLEAPAHAEIVIEGVMPAGILEEEGPFAEHTGYARAGAGLNPIVNVTAITRRHDAIYYALQGGRPIAASQVLDGMPMEVVLYNHIKDVGGYVDVKDVVALPYAGGSHIIVVQMTPHEDGQVKDVLMATLSSPYIHPKIAIAVDDDVDPHDPTEIFWSISTRVNPARDVFIVPGTRGHHLDPSGELVTPPGAHPQVRVNSKMGIDATKPPTRTPDARDYFTRSWAKGFDEVDLDDYL